MDPRSFRNTSLVAFLAWVGLGTDGLSSAYGPEEAFKALGIQRRLQFAGLQAIVLPIRVFEGKKKAG